MTRKPKRLWIDLETRSTVDLRKATPYRYTEDEHFRILMGSYATDIEPVVLDVEDQDQLMDRVGEWVLDPEVIKVAHNAPFERICFSAVLGLPVGRYLDPRMFHDTQAVAGCKGYPQKLATLAPALGAAKKDEAGTHLINWFCKPTKDGTFRRPEDHPEKWAAFVAYCNQDVVSLIDVDAKLGDFPTEGEREIYFADQIINDIGLPIDVANIERAAEAVRLNAIELEAELSQITGLAKPNNPSTLREWLTAQPTHNRKRLRMADLRAETVEAKLGQLDKIGEPDTPLRKALELRQEIAGTASKKFGAALYAVSSDGRMRGAFRYFGAHTGRWSGRGAQPQNLPRHTFGPTVQDIETITEMKELGLDPSAFEKLATDRVVDTAIDVLELTGRLSPDELKRLVRPMFTGPSWGDDEDLTVVDYAAIEARVIAWLAGEEWALQAFREGRDIYVETAERMGGMTRAQGKIAVLALGYQGGVGSLRAMAGPKDDFINDQSDDEIREGLVLPWRKANAKIVRFWYELEDAFAKGFGKAGRITVSRSTDALGDARHLHLPSGRSITYHGVRHETYSIPVEVTVRGKDGKAVKRTVYKQQTGYRYANPKDPFNTKMRIPTYGGRLAENVTQAVARDVLGEALVRLVAQGYRPVGHVHDEALVEGNALAKVQRVMEVPPTWAKGLPIDGDGFTCRRYKKG